MNNWGGSKWRARRKRKQRWQTIEIQGDATNSANWDLGSDCQSKAIGEYGENVMHREGMGRKLHTMGKSLRMQQKVKNFVLRGFRNKMLLVLNKEVTMTQLKDERNILRRLWWKSKSQLSMCRRNRSQNR